MKETKCSNFTGSILILLFSWFGRGAAREKLKSGKSLALLVVLYGTLFMWDVKKTKIRIEVG